MTFTLAGVASMGLPGFSGFVAELQVLIGAWQAFPTLAVLAGVGILVGVAYTLRALQKAIFSAMRGAPAQHAERPRSSRWNPISVPERIGAVILIASVAAHRALSAAAAGLDPALALSSPLFDWLPKGGCHDG